jgi:hypothetical protein
MQKVRQFSAVQNVQIRDSVFREILYDEISLCICIPKPGKNAF